MRSIPTACPDDLVADADDELTMMREACAPFLAHIRLATQHGDACNPYRLGVRKEAGIIAFARTILPVMAISKMELSAGNQKEAFEQLTDVARFSQDLARGGTGWFEASLSRRFIGRVVSILEQELNRSSHIDEDLLIQLRDELTQLIETQPHPSSIILGDLNDFIFIPGMAAAKKDNWLPPEHWGKFPETPIERTEDHLSAEEWKEVFRRKVKTDDHTWRITMAFDQLRKEYRRACPEASLPLDCYRGFRRYSDGIGKPPEGIWRYVDMYIASAKGDANTVLQERLVKVINATTSENLLNRLPEHSRIDFYLAALRLMVDYRLVVEETANCPHPNVLNDERFQEHRTDPFSGKTIRIVPISTGRFELRPPFPSTQDSVSCKQTSSLIIQCPHQLQAAGNDRG